MATKIEIVAAALLQKMPENDREGDNENYFHSQIELGRALKRPYGYPTFSCIPDPEWGKSWDGPMDGGVTYWAQQMMKEISEVRDPITLLPEYQELQAILEETGYPCDASKMTQEEWLEVTGVVVCPTEFNDRLLALLKQRTNPN